MRDIIHIFLIETLQMIIKCIFYLLFLSHSIVYLRLIRV